MLQRSTWILLNSQNSNVIAIQERQLKQNPLDSALSLVSLPVKDLLARRRVEVEHAIVLPHKVFAAVFAKDWVLEGSLAAVWQGQSGRTG